MASPPRRGATPDPSPVDRSRPGPGSPGGLEALGRRIDGAGAGPGGANEGGLRALGERVDSARPTPGRSGGGGNGAGGARPGRRRRRWSRRRKLVFSGLSLLLLVALVAGGLYGYARYRYDQIQKIDVASEHAQVPGQPFNILVIGSDSRVGAQASTGVGTSSTVTGQRSDVVMVWHVVPATKQITILSIPRDTMLQMVGANAATFGRFNRINASYNAGATALVQTIQANLGIPIAHVVQVDFGGFKGSVNALGGVYMDFKYPAKDAYSGLDITTTGCQLLNGTQALAVARSRHYQYFATGQWQYTGTSDFGRIKRQDAFLRALVDAAKSKYNPLTINAFIGSLPQGIEIDKTMSLGDLVGLAEDFHSITPSTIATYTLPTVTRGFVTPWGDVLFVAQPQAQELLVSVFGSTLMKPTSPPPDETLVAQTPPAVVAPTTTTAPAGGATTTTTTVVPQNVEATYDPTPCSP